MLTKEALRFMKSSKNGAVVCGDFSTAKMYDEIINCISKQIPKKPVQSLEVDWLCPNDCGGKDNDRYSLKPRCKVCGHLIETPENYCIKCGQKIDKN